MAVNVSELLNLDFDQQFGLAQGMPADVRLSKEGFKESPITINLAEKKGIGVGAIAKEEDEEVEDATKALQKAISGTTVGDIKAAPVTVARNINIPSVNRTYQPVASIDSKIPVVETQDASMAAPNVTNNFFDTGDFTIQPESTTAIENVASFAGSGKGQDLISSGLKFFDVQDKPIGTSFLPGYQPATGTQAMKLAEARGSSSYYQTTGSPTLTGQIGGAATAVTSAYSVYDALKGGIDSPTEALQFAGGTLGTLAGLQTAGVLGGTQFASLMAGPVGWAIAGASFLAASGILGGKGKSKPPMGGVEFRLVDDAGKQHAYTQEGQNRRIKAVNPHSYNGYNASALLAQANKNVDYMYAFADEFGLKVNEKAWSQAAFGGDGVDKYMPRGRQAPYRSVLERIDSAGDGSVSPSEWLRHAMEYEGPNGERIIEGDIYKGIRIGPNGMPMKVGYKTQEAFQEAVADFNKRFYGE
jgi:hypothetical protein